jgi:phage shock protein C
MNDRLYRSRHDRMLAGVAGGLAELWDADPSLVRVLWAVLVVLTGGLALLVYIVMAIVVPEEQDYPVTGIAPTGTAPAGTAPAAAPPVAPSATAAETAAAPGSAPAASTPPPAATGFYADPRDARRAARAARRADRRANRSNMGPLLIGAFLVILGAFFLAREWWPQIDFDWFWPAMLIVLGVVVLAAALRRDESGHGNEDRGSTR